MDFAQFAKDFANQPNMSQILILILSLMLGGIGGYFAAYGKAKGEQRAREESFTQVLKELSATEEVKSSSSERISTWLADLEYRKQQLAEFYGPIHAYLRLTENLYRLWMAHKLSEINDSIIALFHQQNEAIAGILVSKAHLVDGAEIPDSFAKYMTSIAIWNRYTSRAGKPFVEDHVAQLPEARFPIEFTEYIYSKTKELKTELDRQYKEVRKTRSVDDG